MEQETKINTQNYALSKYKWQISVVIRGLGLISMNCHSYQTAMHVT